MDLLPLRLKWFDSAGDATEISVRPDAVLQKTTDPEIIFKSWLASPHGLESRLLLAKFKLFKKYSFKMIEKFRIMKTIGLELKELILLLDTTNKVANDLLSVANNNKLLTKLSLFEDSPTYEPTHIRQRQLYGFCL